MTPYNWMRGLEEVSIYFFKSKISILGEISGDFMNTFMVICRIKILALQIALISNKNFDNSLSSTYQQN